MKTKDAGEQKLYKALEEVQQVELRTQVLLSCSACGMTTQELAEIESGSNYREVYSALEWLVKNKWGYPPLLVGVPMRLGSGGRPPRAYLLTEFGAQVLRLLDSNAARNPLRFNDQSAWSHRFAQTFIYTHARRQSWKVEIEKYIANNSIRCDSILHRDGEVLYVEIEQDLPRNNLWRAEEKFQKWGKFAATRSKPVRLVFVFNPVDQDLEKTVENWSHALGRVQRSHGPLKNLLVQHIPISAFFKKKVGDVYAQTVDMQPIMEAEEIVVVPAPTEATVSNHQVVTPIVLEHLQPLYQGFLECVSELHSADTAQNQLRSFFKLAEYIYQASYYHGSDSKRYAVYPRRSIWLLRIYLELPENQSMVTEFREALKWVQGRSASSGLIMFRNHMTHIVWDIFMKHHRLSSGGSLRLVFNIPDFQDIRSDFWVKVTFFNSNALPEYGEYKTRELCEAVSWMLTALFSYSEELGFGQRPWRQIEKNKTNRRKRKS